MRHASYSLGIVLIAWTALAVPQDPIAPCPDFCPDPCRPRTTTSAGGTGNCASEIMFEERLKERGCSADECSIKCSACQVAVEDTINCRDCPGNDCIAFTSLKNTDAQCNPLPAINTPPFLVVGTVMLPTATVMACCTGSGSYMVAAGGKTQTLNLDCECP